MIHLTNLEHYIFRADQLTVDVESSFIGIRNVEKISRAGIHESLRDVDLQIGNDQRAGVHEIHEVGSVANTTHHAVVLVNQTKYT